LQLEVRVAASSYRNQNDRKIAAFLSRKNKKWFFGCENKDQNIFLYGSNRLVIIYDSTPSVSCPMISSKMAYFVLASIA